MNPSNVRNSQKSLDSDAASIYTTIIMVVSRTSKKKSLSETTGHFKHLVLQVAALAEALVDSEGEITPESEVLLVHLNEALKTRADVYYEVLKRLEREASYCRKEASEWADKARRREKTVDTIKNHLKDGMISLQQSRLEGHRHSFTLQRGRMMAVINSEEFPSHLERPDLYREEVSYRINKHVVEQRLAEGHAIPGASLEPVFALRSHDRFPTLDVPGEKQ